MEIQDWSYLTYHDCLQLYTEQQEALASTLQTSSRLFQFAENELKTREDRGDREGSPHTHPIPEVIRLELVLVSG